MAEPHAGRGTYSLAVATGAVNASAILWMILAFTFVEELVEIVLGGSPGLVMDFLFASLVTYGALRTFLSGGRLSGVAALVPPGGGLPWSFLLRDLLLAVPGILAMMMFGGLFYPLLGAGGGLVAGIAAGLLAQSVAYALFGTMLAEIAQGGDGDPERALARGRQVFVPVVLALLAGPALAELALFVFSRTIAAAGLPQSAWEPGAEHVSPVGFTVDIVLHCGRSFVSVLTAVVLGRAWLKAV